jgi:hypothetical protein
MGGDGFSSPMGKVFGVQSAWGKLRGSLPNHSIGKSSLSLRQKSLAVFQMMKRLDGWRLCLT